MSYTVLYDGACSVCRRAIGWLAGEPKLVELEFVPIGSEIHLARAPWLHPNEALAAVTVLGPDGAVYRGDAAWITCLWALARYRRLSHTLAHPRMRGRTKAVVDTVARRRRRDVVGPSDCADGACAAPRSAV